MTTLTAEQFAAIASKVASIKNIAAGLGTKESPCTLAAINLALTGKLTGTIPKCMSPVIGQWIIKIQDAMPANIRNSQRWRDQIPHAAGTGRDHEQERVNIILEWMWATVLPQIRPIADRHGFGDAWSHMCSERTAHAAKAAAGRAWASAWAAAWAAAWASAWAAAGAVAWAAAAAGEAAAAAGAAENAAEGWDIFDPSALLEKLIAVSEESACGEGPEK